MTVLGLTKIYICVVFQKCRLHLAKILFLSFFFISTSLPTIANMSTIG